MKPPKYKYGQTHMLWNSQVSDGSYTVCFYYRRENLHPSRVTEDWDKVTCQKCRKKLALFNAMGWV